MAKQKLTLHQCCFYVRHVSTPFNFLDQYQTSLNDKYRYSEETAFIGGWATLGATEFIIGRAGRALIYEVGVPIWYITAYSMSLLFKLKFFFLCITIQANNRCFLFCTSVYVNMTIHRSGGSVVRAFAPWAGGRGFDPRPRHTKDVIKMVPDASLLGAQHNIRTGLASLSSQTSFKKRDGYHPEWAVESD